LNHGTNPFFFKQQVRAEVSDSPDVLHAIPGVLERLHKSKLELLA
jgi:hypothetical protein